ncbi:uncharacterized protein PV09_05307 [Verruconis gallopava]|uniref:Tat pathway signal sequence n=1 Tax=Verruconis gallopava TaxID=253628 RepID=A0A0D1XM85_9PEZI|nr:uncharacterized protein PV09_05307 [Verruconis gallopava]KIW03546.1 hypothetical protein PV09_05307 [Verruconis gallopava]
MWLIKSNSASSYKGDAEESLLSSDRDWSSRIQAHKGWSPTKIAVLVVSHVTLAVVGLLLGIRWSKDPIALATQVTARYSPFIRDVGLKFEVVEFNGSFFHETVFRQDAGPEVDAAWRSLGVDYRALRVPAEESDPSGLSSEQVKINSKYGGGYPANVEGLHHLHCLNLLRQALYFNFEYYHALGEGAFKNDDQILKSHITHCLDILRQQLMCTVDVGMMGQIWWDPTSPKAFVDFNTKHICRNFEDVRKWAEARQLPETPPADFLQPPEPGQYISSTIP